jgi:hypothetical protein
LSSIKETEKEEEKKRKEKLLLTIVMSISLLKVNGQVNDNSDSSSHQFDETKSQKYNLANTPETFIPTHSNDTCDTTTTTTTTTDNQQSILSTDDLSIQQSNKIVEIDLNLNMIASGDGSIITPSSIVDDIKHNHSPSQSSSSIPFTTIDKNDKVKSEPNENAVLKEEVDEDKELKLKRDQLILKKKTENELNNLINLRKCWKIPYIVYFCNLLESKLDLIDLRVDEFEEALLDDCGLDRNIVVIHLLKKLLKPFVFRSIDLTNYEAVLLSVLRRYSLENLFLSSNESAEMNQWCYLSLLTKVDIIYQLCELRLNLPDMETKLAEFEPSDLRIEPLGIDSEGNKLWYFGDLRLYEEKMPIIKKNKPQPVQTNKKNQKNNNKKTKKETICDEVDSKKIKKMVQNEQKKVQSVEITPIPSTTTTSTTNRRLSSRLNRQKLNENDELDSPTTNNNISNLKTTKNGRHSLPLNSNEQIKTKFSNSQIDIEQLKRTSSLRREERMRLREQKEKESIQVE